MSSPLEKFLASVAFATSSDPKPRGDRYECKCPAHEDEVASLSVGHGEKGVVVKCHAGCSAESVVAALGMKMSDLFNEPRTNSNGHASTSRNEKATVVRERSWDILDVDGAVVATHVRQDLSNGKKKFVWRRNGLWNLGGLAGEDLPLYGSERLRGDPISPVVVCEGEKAADALRERGILALATVTGAAGCPSDAVLATLSQRDVILWPDNDPAGKKHMSIVGVGLKKITKALRLVFWKDAPLKGDAADFRGDRDAVLDLLDASVPFIEEAEKPEEELRTELGNGKRIVRMFGEKLRFTGAIGWHAWDGKRWAADDTAEATRLAKKAIVSMLDEAKALGASEHAESLVKWAIKSQKASIIDSSLRLAQSEKGIACRRTDFDKDPWLLNVQNGTLDLKTASLRPHDQGDLITRICAAGYDPSAHSPLWESFLEKFLPDADVRAFFKRYLGSCLTGDATDQALVILYGPGGNGKSTAIETVTAILADYFVGTPFSTLTMRRDRGAATNDLACLAGARFVVASEPPEGASLNSSTVKLLTGGDTITARHLYKDFFSFIPQFKLALVTNHRPDISESTHAIWRRVFLVPFSVTISEAERDENFKAALWKERNGILRWLVDGCSEWQTIGLSSPDAVTAATDEYRREEDSFAAFLEECSKPDVHDSQARASEILKRYNSWAKANGIDTLNVKILGGKLREKGFRSHKSHGVVLWHGIALTQEQRGEDGEDQRSFS